MKKSVLIVLIAVFSVFGLSSSAHAGLLQDWGVDLSTNQWTPTTEGVLSKLSVGTQDPGYGGQPYDAEAMYLFRDNNNAYISVVTGMPQIGWPHPSANPAPNIYPGDFAINLGGAWVQGGDPLTYQYGIKTSSNQGGPVGGIAGSPGAIYGNVGWGATYDWNGVVWGSQNNPTVIKTGTVAGQSAFNYYSVTGPGNLTHYVYEAAIPTGIMDFSSGGSVHWTMTCGNDALNLNFPGGTPIVPEPISASLFLLGSGVLALNARRRMKATK